MLRIYWSIQVTQIYEANDFPATLQQEMISHYHLIKYNPFDTEEEERLERHSFLTRLSEWTSIRKLITLYTVIRLYRNGSVGNFFRDRTDRTRWLRNRSSALKQ